MFSSIGLFKETQCPGGTDCTFIACMFSHDEPPPINAGLDVTLQDDYENQAPPAKKRRLAETEISQPAQHRKALIIIKGQELKQPAKVAMPKPALKPQSILTMRPVSPPPPKRVKVSKDTTSPLVKRSLPVVSEKPAKAEPLIPRIMTIAPAQLAIRNQLLKLIFREIERLNKLIELSNDKDKNPLLLSSQEMITLALDEEELVAKNNPTVYSNVLKLRIQALRKLNVKDWRQERCKQIEKEEKKRLEQIENENPNLFPASSAPKPKSKRVHTGLSSHEELAMITNLVTPITELSAFGYVAHPPSRAEIEQARQGIEAAKGWEVCDRCQVRFQVFPGRRTEDGVLATGGRCTHHWGKLRRPPSDKTGASGAAGGGVSTWTCCRGEVNTTGCTKAENHVFKISEVKRLALIMEFEETPRNERLEGGARKRKKGGAGPGAVCFDCEMGYTSRGLELIRLTATAWPSGEELLDVLVRPLGEVLDLNSRFSGVFPEDFTQATPWDQAEPPPPSPDAPTAQPRTKKLHIVPSPRAARALLFSLLTPATPLIGHAIENDLNATRICHPLIVDTVLLFPHPMRLPIRYGLKALMKRHCDVDVQMGGARGHDSKEDARAAGELVRFRVAQRWREMVREGWRVQEGVFYPPDRVVRMDGMS